MKQSSNNRVHIDPKKLQETAQKKKTITMIAVLVVILIFFGWLAFFRLSLLTEPARPNEGWRKIKSTFGEFNLALSDFKNDWREAKEKEQKLAENLNNNNNVNLNLTNSQVAFLKEKVQEKIKEQKENNPDQDWQYYRNDKYELEFKYPIGWQLNTRLGDGVIQSLDIHLENQLTIEGPECSTGFLGLEIITPSLKDKNQDFASWLKTRWLDSHALGGPSGTMEVLRLGDNQVYKSQYSGWDVNCDGPGYFIEQNPESYLYIYTGLADNNQTDGLAMLEKIISTIKFINN